MHLEDVILSEISQTEKDKFCRISFTWNIKKQTKKHKISDQTKQKQTHRNSEQSGGYQREKGGEQEGKMGKGNQLYSDR